MPVNDPELRSALTRIAGTRELLQHAERWKAWRAYAAVLLMGSASPRLAVGTVDMPQAFSRSAPAPG